MHQRLVETTVRNRRHDRDRCRRAVSTTGGGTSPEMKPSASMAKHCGAAIEHTAQFFPKLVLTAGGLTMYITVVSAGRCPTWAHAVSAKTTGLS